MHSSYSKLQWRRYIGNPYALQNKSVFKARKKREVKAKSHKQFVAGNFTTRDCRPQYFVKRNSLCHIITPLLIYININLVEFNVVERKRITLSVSVNTDLKCSKDLRSLGSLFQAEGWKQATSSLSSG